MNIFIIGAGQLGYFLSKSLLEAGHQVKIIDTDRTLCEQLANTFDLATVCGDGTRVETLANAGIGKCDVFIAATGHDEDNLIACEIAKKQFGVKRTIAQANNNKNIDLMKRLGVDIVMDSTRIITDLIEHEIEGSDVKLLADIENSDAVISEYAIPASWSLSGTAISALGIPEDCVLVYIMRGSLLLIPRGSTILMAGDNVVALTLGGAARKLRKLFEI